MAPDVARGSETSEGLSLSIPFRTSTTRLDSLGSGSSSACPRSGSMLLETWDQRRLFVNTNCNTWRCISCRDRLMARFKKRVSTGVSTLGQCIFITLTYQVDGFIARGALCVKRDWEAFLRRLRKNCPELAAMKWLRVMELTRKGVPHFHLVMGPVPLGRRIRCWRRDEKVVAAGYLARMARCDCIAHALSREWYAVTGDSWMVHAIPVTGAKGAGGYLAKYMRKEFDGERAAALGMSRRWSTSVGWPGGARRRLRQSEMPEGWRRRSFRYGHVESDIEGGPDDVAARSGSEADLAADSQRAAKRVVTAIRSHIC